MKAIRRIAWVALTLLALHALNSFAQDSLQDPPPPPLYPGRILDGWELSDSNFVSFFRHAPVSVTNVSLVESWNEYSLQVDTTNVAWLTYAVVEPDGKTVWGAIRRECLGAGGIGKGTDGRQWRFEQ